MKSILIVYASKTGSTATAAQLLCDRLKGREVTLCTTDAPEADPAAYDIVVIGGCIRYGKLYKPVAQYLKKWDAVLKDKKTGYFLLCGYPDSVEEYYDKVLTEAQAERAFSLACFGGEMVPAHAKNLWDKLVLKIQRDNILGGGNNGDQREDMVLPTISEENIAQFAGKLKVLSL
jgi:menaquinone-dependent protoporphyrinogen IX oxidase